MIIQKVTNIYWDVHGVGQLLCDGLVYVYAVRFKCEWGSVVKNQIQESGDSNAYCQLHCAPKENE